MKGHKVMVPPGTRQLSCSFSNSNTVTEPINTALHYKEQVAAATKLQEIRHLVKL